ncbi:hypothetical protein [Aphanothece hegewaldii]|uniref:hypothetical protein n=1 Tax=Aphanothece hegewaldii TaxID=1521625 RepID=UPI001FE8AEB2|nr:hypothetical protein [Aphanothece hegewaldii]
MSEDRLDRLEALAEKILEGLAETRQRTDSNAKSIQALSDTVAQDRKEWAQDRRRVFEWMARLAAAQADFYEMQADHLSHVEKIDDRLSRLERIDALRSSPRRERLTDILDRLTPKPDQEQA